MCRAGPGAARHAVILTGPDRSTGDTPPPVAPPPPAAPPHPESSTAESATALLDRAELAVDVLAASRRLLGCVLEADTADGVVAVRLSEVEAYRGADDPAAHSFRGRTARNAVMFGPPGHLYVYFVYGLHFCANVSCLPDGEPGAVLLRAGTVLTDPAMAHARRPTARHTRDLARGPARLAALLGLDRSRGGVDVLDPASPVRLQAGAPVAQRRIRSGPRVGVAAAHERPWRFWIDGDPTVSPYRAGRGAPRDTTSTHQQR